jgi:hypothetical protein
MHFFFKFLWVGWDWGHLVCRPLLLLYQPRMIDDDYGAVGGMRIGRGNRCTWRIPVTLSTTNPTWPDLGANPGRQGGKPATNCLSYGTALMHMLVTYIYTICTRPVSVQAENIRSCSFLNSLGCNGSLVIWTVVCLTTTKFKPLVLSVPGI